MKRFILLGYCALTTLLGYAQQWVMDEIADEAKESEPLSFRDIFIGVIFIGAIYLIIKFFVILSKDQKHKKEIKKKKVEEIRKQEIEKFEQRLTKNIIHPLPNKELTACHSITVYSSNVAMLKLFNDNECIATIPAFYDIDEIEFDKQVYIPQDMREKDADGNIIITNLPSAEGEPLKSLFPDSTHIEIEKYEDNLAVKYDFEIRSWNFAPTFYLDRVKLVKHNINDNENTSVYVMKYIYHTDIKVELTQKLPL